MFNSIIKRDETSANGIVKSMEEALGYSLRDPFSSRFPFFPLDPFSSLGKVDKFFALPTDVYRDGDNIVTKTEVAGVSKEDIEISYEDGNLTISATKKFEGNNSQENHHEIKYGKLTRSFPIKENVDFDKSTASLKDGILTVTLPVIADVPKKKTIMIEEK